MTQKTENKSKFSKKNIQDIVALTPMQEGLLFHYLKDSENNDYLNQLELTLKGDIQIEHFEKAWQYVVNTNEMLRTVFLWEGVKNPVQIIKKEASVEFTFIDDNTLDIEKLKQEDKAKGFTISESCFRLILIKTEAQTYKLIITNHHIIYDGWSNGIMVKSVLDTYSKLIKGDTIKLTIPPVFKQYVKLKGEQANVSKAYWNTYLSDYDVSVFMTASNQEQIKGTSKTISCNLPSDLVSKIERYSKTKKTSVASIFYASWGILMQKYSNTKDILFGTAISDRPKEIRGIENAIGLFIKTVPFRCTVSENITLEDLILKSNLDLIEHQEKGNGSLNDIIKTVNNNQPGKGEVFETMFTFENYPINATIFSNKDIKIESFTSSEKTHYALEAMIEKDNGFKLTVTYNDVILDNIFATALLNHYKTILNTIFKSPKIKISELNILTKIEEIQLLEEFNTTQIASDDTATLYNLFKEQVVKNPNAIALQLEDEIVTYKELETRSEIISNDLIAQNLPANATIGLILPRSIELVVSIFGILRAGMCYVPIDISSPKKRMLYVIENSKCSLVISNNYYRQQLNLNYIEHIISIETMLLSATSKNKASKGEVQTSSSSLAYIIYTSGTTGNPKGVKITHKSLINYIKWATKTYLNTNADVFPLYSSISFDLTLTSIFLPLLTGNTIIIYKEDAQTGTIIEDVIKNNKATILKLTPSHLKIIKEIEIESSAIKTLIVGGEALTSQLCLDVINKLGDVTIYNEYGPTEATIGCMTYQFDKSNISVNVSLGKPIDNTQIYILDATLKPVPFGIAGVLYIAGDGLSEGYVYNKELTALKFIKNPFIEGARMYHSGDLVKRNTDGSIIFIGRVDNQVKIRGYRIELGEIEGQLTAYEAIDEAIVRVKQNDNEKSLVAYYKAKKNIDSKKLRKYLIDKLPQYMLPSSFIKIDKFPLTSNGKIDDNVLLNIKNNTLKVAVRHPKNNTELLLLKIWNEVINNENISVSDNFFEIGGDSLNMIRLSSAINKAFDTKIKITDLFKYASIKSLAQFIDGENEDIKIEEQKQDKGTSEQKSNDTNDLERDDIAIIGMAGRFPKATTIEAFWNNLKGAVEGITIEENDDNTLIKAKGHLEEKTHFDNSFFGYTPREAAMMDPQTRVLHECVWEALEDSGYNSYQYDGKIALFAGSSFNPYYGVDVNTINPEDLIDNFDAGTYAERDFLTSRISYKLNLKGVGVTVLTACSTSLVAIDMACSKLHLNECDIALAGGVSITFHDDNGYLFKEGMILSPDGRCRAFDKDASGTVGGNGAGVVVLKKLKRAIADNDNILAVIKGTATNNDGHYKVGYTAPSVTGQAEVIKEAIAKAKVNPEDITYIEAHGTGTSLGDPIEIEGLTTAFNTNKKQYCAVGSVKTSIGHLDAAAGVAGVIKTVLSLKNKKLLPSLNFKEVNPEIDLENSPFFVNTTLKGWNTENKPRIAGVSSFGIGGTNAHIILQEAPETEALQEKEDTQLILISGQSKDALNANTNALEQFIERNPETNSNQLGYILQTTREHFPQRRFAIANNLEDLKEKLSKQQYRDGRINKNNESIVFMFTGQGAQYVNMTADLYAKNNFYTTQVNQCLEIITQITGEDFKTILFNKNLDSKINETYYTQALLFAVEYAMAHYLMHLNLKPTRLIGHSIGEYVAACIAGVFSLEDALKIVLKRGALMQKAAPGTMLSVSRSAERITKIIPANLDMAAINTEESCVVSGSHEDIEAFQNKLKQDEIPCVKLKISHGFHSSTMNPVLEEFEAYLATFEYNNPKIPLISNYTGTWITNEEATSPKYWTKHLRNTVKFSEGIKILHKENNNVYIEVGPSRTLANFVKTILVEEPPVVFNSVRHPKERKNDYNYFLQQIGAFWVEGFNIDWKHLQDNKSYRKLSLPTYAFQKNEFPLPNKTNAKSNSVTGKVKGISNWFYKENWKLSTLEKHQEHTFDTSTFLIFSDNSTTSNQLIETVRAKGKTVIVVEKGNKFQYQKSKETYIINPWKEADFKTLSQEIELLNIKQYIYCWTLENSNAFPEVNLSSLKEINADFYYCAFIFKHFKFENNESPHKFSIITNGHANLNANYKTDVASSAITALLQIAMQETQDCFNCSIDIDNGNYSEIVDDLIYNIKETNVAYKSDFRFANFYEQYQPIEIENQTTLKEKGVYLITGGIGNAALTIAESLLSNYEANVILMGRSKLPNNLVFNAEVDKHREEKIQWINKLKEFKGTLSYTRGDVAKQDELAETLKVIKAEYGMLNGIIHTAGNVNSDTFDLVDRINVQNIEGHFAPKVAGILNIYNETKEDEIDFVWATSSLSAVLGGPSYAAYAGANNYMDHLVEAFAKKAQNQKWISVKLDGLSFNDNSLINKKELVAIFEKTLHSQEIGRTPTISISDLFEKDGTKAIIEGIWEIDKTETVAVSNRIKRPELSSVFIAPKTAFQKQIVALWAESFGYEVIGIQDNYFDLGGDSLKAIAITSKMEQITGKNISLPAFLSNPTIEELSLLIENTDVVEEFSYPRLTHDATNVYQPFPLTPIQLAYLLGRSNNIELGGISTHGYVEIEASLDAERLSKALQKVVDRHAILRTVITHDGNQRILEGDLQYDLKIDDISHLSEVEKTKNIESVRQIMSHQVFDIYKWPLFEMKVFQITGDKVYIFFGIDLIISDAGSTDLFASELMQYYRNPELKLPVLEFTFRDYVLGLAAIKKSPFYKKDSAYWLDKLGTFPSAPELPVKVSPSTIDSPRFNRLEKIFDATAWKQLKRIASKNNITPSVLLCTAFTEVLAFWGNQQELALNMTLFNRLPFHDNVPKMMGDFTSLVLLNVQLDRKMSFFENAKVVQKTLFETMDHRHYDGVECITELRRLKGLGDKAVMPVVFTSTLQENDDDELNFWNELGDLKKSISQTPQVFLDHQLMLKEGTLMLGWDFVEQLFDEDIIESMFNQYIQRIELLLEDEIPEALVVPNHHLKLLEEYNTSYVNHTKSVLQDLFYTEDAINSEVIAIENADIQWTYKELFRKANQVAAFLKSKAIGRGDFVGVSTDRNEYTICNILGILIAGAAYVPIDNTHPEDRKKYILGKSNCKWMLAFNAYSEENIAAYSNKKHETVSQPEDIAYIIFTSGSTGQPKGVVIKHRAVVNTIVDINERFGITNADRILGISSLTFDLSVYDIFGSLHAGARLVLLDNQRDVELIKNTIETKGITVWNSVPAIMDMLTKYFNDTYVNTTLSKVMLSGDWIPVPLPEKINTHFPNAAIISMGGATEASIWSIYYPVEKVNANWKSIPYGYPLGNQTFYVLNINQEQCPVNVIGELYIGGVGVAEGYINEEILTKNAFIEHSTFGRIYKTGDYGAFRQEGYIEFLGRKDNQVKIRGYRIELGEVSTHLRAYEGIKQAIAIDYTTDSGEKNLAAYYVSEQEINGETLKDYLSHLLPDYMLPAFMSRIEDIPLTPNGKINRKALAIPKENLLTKNSKKEQPQTVTEKLVFSKWQSILNTEHIGIHEDFFLVGGNSIKLIELFKLLEADFQNIKVNKLFEYRTIHSFSSHIEEQTTEKQAPKRAKSKITF